jgi:plastocyanin
MLCEAMTSARSHRPAAFAFFAALTLVAAILAGHSAPARAFDTSGSFTAVDLSWGVTGTGASSVHVDPGSVVTFGYPSGFSAHNADFGANAPSSCTGMPGTPTAAGWSGSCTFNNTGTYTFFCDLHASMTGTVLVGDVPDPPPPPSGGGGGGGGGSNTGGDTAGGGGSTSDPLSGLKLAKTQKGSKVTGSIASVAAGSALSIEITAKPSALKTSSTKPVRVGRVVKSDLPSGTAKFSIKLSSKALRAIKKKGKLAVTVTIKLTLQGGSTAKTTKSVTLKKS